MVTSASGHGSASHHKLSPALVTVPPPVAFEEPFLTDPTYVPRAAAIVPHGRKLYNVFPWPSAICTFSRIVDMLSLNYLLSLLPPLLRWPQDPPEGDGVDNEKEKDDGPAGSGSRCPVGSRHQRNDSGYETELEGLGKTKPHVLLLRTPAVDGYCGTDKYEDAFRARGYRAANVSVLETVYTNIDRLQEVVWRGGADYAGVVVTSGRACGAWRLAVRQLAEGTVHTGADKEGIGWSHTPFYVVGQSTASALQGIHSAPHASPYCPRDIRGSTESGTGDKLAHFIVKDLAASPPPSSSKKLLYLTGDKTKGTLPAIAAAAGFEVETLQVYATQGSTRFEDDLSGFLDAETAQEHDRTVGEQASKRWWIVHFAPSSAKHVSPILKKYFDVPMHDGAEGATGNRRARLAVIGPTTATALEAELKMRVDVVAAKPNPEALAEGIARFDESDERRDL